MSANKNTVSELSPHLFWDCRQEEISWEEHEIFLVQRVLEYGILSDWKAMLMVYGLEKIVSISINLRSLDMISANFISTISKTPIENFKCYTQRQSLPHYSGY